jgi:hypothetical protein
MKKTLILIVIILLTCGGMTTVITAAEWGYWELKEYFYPESVADQIIRFLLLIVMIIGIVFIAVMVVVKVGHVIKRGKNDSFISPVVPSQPSQFAFIEKSYCSRCGRFTDCETKECPFCGNNLE